MNAHTQIDDDDLRKVFTAKPDVIRDMQLSDELDRRSPEKLITFARQIMANIIGDEYLRPGARTAAQIALDAIDEVENEMGWTRTAPIRGAVS